MSVRAVVDARLAWNSGIGTYIRNVVPRVARLAPDWRFSVITDARRAEWAEAPNVSLLHSETRIFTLREQVELPWRTPSDTALFWSTHYNFPLLTGVRRVATIHDVGHLRLAEYRDSLAKRAYAGMMFAALRRQASGLLFDSEFSLREFRSLVGTFDGPEAVVHLGVDRVWSEAADDAPPLAQPYFVHVGNIKPHKNIHVLLDAFEQVRDRLGAQLVLIGRADQFRTPDRTIETRVASMPRVAFLGELRDADVRRYVRHATALVVPSFYEGFGLPPLEAMAAGTPALVSRAGSLPEVCGDGAEYFDPPDSSALAELLARAAGDASFRRDLTERGRARVRRFDWDVTARETYGLLQRAIAA